MSIAVFLEIRDGAVKKASLEALSEARRWGDQKNLKVCAVAVGAASEDAIQKVSECKPDRILLADEPVLASYSARGYTAALAAAIRQENAKVVFGAHTAMGKEVLPRTAAHFGTSVLSDIVTLEWNDSIVVRRPVYSGKAYAQVASKGDGPIFVSLRANVFPIARPETGGEPEVSKISSGLQEDQLKTRLVEIRPTVSETVELTEAEIIVSGGRGMKGPEHFSLIKDLANVLGAAMGASRAVVDAGWIDHQYQVGQTGKVVSPSLYIACGISGAIQHLAGMSSSKYIVAINKDPDAPIFKLANYGIVGDVFDVLPPLTEEIRKLKNE